MGILFRRSTKKRPKARSTRPLSEDTTNGWNGADKNRRPTLAQDIDNEEGDEVQKEWSPALLLIPPPGSNLMELVVVVGRKTLLGSCYCR